MARLGKVLIRGLKQAAEIYGLKVEKLPWYKAAWEAFYFSKTYEVITEPYNKTRRFVLKCKKVLQFLPIVWRHEDWDSAYTLEFMSYLFKRMYTAVYVEGHHVEHPKHKRRLKVATELLKRMSKGDYTAGHLEYLERTYGQIDYQFKTTVDEKSGRRYTTMVDETETSLEPSKAKIYKKLKSHYFGKHEDNMYKQDMEMFCKILKKDCRHWWD